MADRSSHQQRRRVNDEDRLLTPRYFQEEFILIKAGNLSRQSRRAKSAAVLNSSSELQVNRNKWRTNVAVHRPVTVVQKPQSSESQSVPISPISRRKSVAPDTAQSTAYTCQENDLVKSKSELQSLPITALAIKTDHKSCDYNEENISHNEYAMDTPAPRDMASAIRSPPKPQPPGLIYPTISKPKVSSTDHHQSAHSDTSKDKDRYVFSSTSEIPAHPQEIYLPEVPGQTELSESFDMTKAILFTSAHHDYGNFQVEWDAIQRMRLDIWGLRSRIHESRNVLRQKQLAKSEADDRYMMRAHADEFGIVFGGNGPSLSELRNLCREARDEYGPLEDDCTDLEDHLSNQEFQLTRAEQRLYLRWNFSSSPDCAPSSPRLEDNPQFLYHGFDFEETQPSYHPLVTQYLSKIGDLEIFKERLEDFMDEKTALEAEKESRRKFNMTLDPEDQAWLDDSERMGREIYEQLQQNETECHHLRSLCVDKGLINENGQPTAFKDLEKAQFMNEKDLEINEQTSEYVKFPLLIPLPSANDYGRDDFERKSDHGQTSYTSNRRINEWILQKLRSSPLDVQLLAEFQKHIRDDDHAWQLHVLSEWFKDGTNSQREGSKESSYMSSIVGQTSVDLENAERSGCSTPRPYFVSKAGSDRTDAMALAAPGIHHRYGNG